MTTNRSVSVSASGIDKRMTLRELTEFMVACANAGIPIDTTVEIKAKGLNKVGIRTITADSGNIED